ncbi:MAG: hypothetical protein HYW25_05660 [Candidatus Aenigmarchaeota archaeon]|nr:hypothetical protein [Candidatus Aenigmarchaeota archaeon]
MKDEHILIFGDSIAYGAWDEEGGWAQRLRKFIDEKNRHYKNIVMQGKNLLHYNYCLIYNLGISGDTSEEVLGRLEFEARQRAGLDNEIILIFAIGVNDSYFVHEKGSNQTEPGKFEQNLRNIIELAREFSDKTIFIGLTPCDESKVDPVPWRPEISYKNKYIKQFNDIVKQVCKENDVNFIEMLDNLSKEDLEDGVHPNSGGHKKIFEIVKDYLVKEKII